MAGTEETATQGADMAENADTKVEETDTVVEETSATADSPDAAVSQALTEAGGDSAAFMAKLNELGFEVVATGGGMGGAEEEPDYMGMSMPEARTAAVDKYFK